MKVLMLNVWNFYNIQGGLEKVFCNMANALTCRGHEVIAICFDKNEGKPFFEIDTKVKVINAGLGFQKRSSFTNKIKRIFVASKKSRHILDVKDVERQMAECIKPYIIAEKPEVIITYNMEGTRILKTFIKCDCPVISMLHGFPQDYFELERYNNRYTKKALKYSECVQVLMPSFVYNFKKFVSHDNVVCIPNAVDFIDDEATLENKNIICVGRVDRIQKRQHLLIEAFNVIRDNHSDWTIYFYGDVDFDKEYFNECTELINKYGLEKNIYFMGNTKRVCDKLLESSIFAFPSAFEGFSLALTEAMSVGLPCIGYKSSPSVNELIVDGKNGILCEDGIVAFARALKELMLDEEKRACYGEQAKEDMKQYAPEMIWNQWEELIKKTVVEYKKKI